MSTPSGSGRVQPAPTPTRGMVQSAPVQPVRSTTAESRAMASIRPLTVAPISGTTTITQQTPTATVMPTTVSVQDSVPSVTPAPAQVRPTQQVQPVSSQVESQITNTESTASDSGLEGTPAHIMSSQEGASTVTEVHTMPVASTSASTGAAEAGEAATPSVPSAKRTHTEMEEEHDSAPVESAPAKRTRVVQEAPPFVEETAEPELATPEVVVEPFASSVSEAPESQVVIAEVSVQPPTESQETVVPLQVITKYT